MDGLGWAEQPGGFDPNPAWTPDAGFEVDTGLRELSRRLDELLISVEMLGVEGRWPGPAPEPAAAAEPAFERWEPPVPTWEEGHAYAVPPPPPAPVYGDWASPAPAAWEVPFDPPAEAWDDQVPSPPPAAPLIEVASLDAGPFADLIELRHFEEDLGELGRVRDVRVRRFGHQRASIEVAVSSAPLLENELALLDREMSIGATPDGDVVVELVPPAPADGDDAIPAQGEDA